MKRLFPLLNINILFFIFSNNQLYSQEIHYPSVINFLDAAKYEKLHPVKRKIDFEKAEINMQKLPGNLPLPPGAIIKRFYPPLQNAARLSGQNVIPMKVSPAPAANFLGASDSVTTIPPDGGGAAGLNHLFAAENHVFVIRNKTGALVSAVSPVTFFRGLVPGFSADPHVKYDQYSNRWIVIGQSETDTLSSVVIAVSQTNDPTGNYNRYVFRIDPMNVQVADFPLLGYNKKWIVVTTNLFNVDLTSFTGTSLFVLDKATLYAGGAIDFSTNAFRQLSGTPDGSNPCPVNSFSDGPIGDEMYLLQSWNATTGTLRLSKISGNLPNLTWPSNSVFPQFASGWTYDGGDLAPQLGDTRNINTGDARVQTLIERNGLMWACQSIFINDRAVIQWMQLSPTGNIIQSGRITAGGSNVFRAFPSLAVTAEESVLVGYTRFSSTTYASAAYSYRNTGTPVNTLDSEFVYKNGLSSYYKTFSGDRNRWGDFSSSAVDPVIGRLWTIQEIAAQRTGTNDNDSRFATWWASVIPDFTNVNVDAAITAVINPLTGSTFCNSAITPKITLRNNGADTLKSATIRMLLDGLPIGTAHNFSGSIAPFESADITLSAFTATVGSHNLKFFSANPNNLADQRVVNDTISVTFIILQTLSLPTAQGFESATFPPAGGWSVFNSDGDLTWARTTVAAKTGNASMSINGFDYPAVGERDIFKSPKIDITTFDSLYVSFDVAYAKFSDENVDTLEVVYSVDCGVTWLPSGYKRWGTTLSTNGGEFVMGDPFIPNAAQWRNDIAKIGKCSIGSNNILVGIKFVNNNGQNCFIDNLKIQGVMVRQKNAQLISVNKPFQTLCVNSFTPEITISNQGSDTLKTLSINYEVDGGPLATSNFTGALARCSQQAVTLNAVTSNAGTHVLTIYTFGPDNGTDQYTPNDTLRLPFTISSNADAPVTEGFEGPVFPPDNWTVLNPDRLLTWERTIDAAKTGIASMVIRNYDYPIANTTDKFISPIVQVPATADSVFASFDYAYAPGAGFPGNTIFPIDTFEIQLTQNCGETVTTIWKKWGEDLQTLDDVSIPFVPTNTSWRNVKLYLNPFIDNQPFQVYFVAKNNQQNNLYVDNINIYTVTLPARLRNQGYLIYPNPFSGTLLVQHYQPPVDLKNISIYNSVGQLVLQKQYSGNANSQIPLNVGYLARGIYLVKLYYSDKTIVQRIVKN
ncbi:MAG: T9SS type A sorting domain-containing protein [Ginsengibacter sp.]